MPSGRFTHAAIRALDWIAERVLAPEKIPSHQLTGRRGEEAAYFYLRKLGYVIVSRNFRSPHRRGELDLIGWQKDILCFIEVKTRTTRAVKPGEAAVDQEKQRELAAMAHEYMRHLPNPCSWRVDIVSVFSPATSHQPEFELFQNILAVA
jgi:putative endonuclease